MNSRKCNNAKIVIYFKFACLGLLLNIIKYLEILGGNL